MPLSVLLNKDGSWQPEQMEGTEQEPISTDVQQLKEWISYRSIGPTGARSRVVSEQQTEVPVADGGKGKEILVQQSVEVMHMDLYTRPPAWAAPCWKNICKQAVAAGVNIDAILYGAEAGAEQLLVSQEQLNELMAAAAAQQQQLQAATAARLTSKLLNEAESKRLQTALMAEGAAGVWDMLSDSSSMRSAGVTGATLRGLMAALRKPVLSTEVQLPAACAVWHACMLTKVRERLVQLGAVEALLQIVDSTFNKLHHPAYSSSGSLSNNGSSCTKSDYLAMLSASLGALAILAVDRSAREHLLASRGGLVLLADVAALPAQAYEHLLQADVQEQQQQEQGQHEDEPQPQDQQQSLPAPCKIATASTDPAAAAAAAATTATVTEQVQDELPKSQPAPAAADFFLEAESVSPQGQRTAAAFDSNVAEDPVAIPVALLEAHPNLLAAEVIAAVLLRDAAVRAAFLQAGNCRLLLQLLRASDTQVQLCGVAAVARMTSTRGMCDKCSQLVQQEPQLLRQIHSSVVNLLQALVQQQQQPTMQQPSEQQAPAQQQQQQQRQQLEGHEDTMDPTQLHSPSSEQPSGVESKHTANMNMSSCCSKEPATTDSTELQKMLLDYTCLALWVTTAAVAQLFTAEEALQQLILAGQLAEKCIRLQGADCTRHSVLCCLAGVLCVIAATPAAAEAAAGLADAAACSELQLQDKAAAVIGAVHPALSAVLSLEMISPEVVQAKFLAAATVMLLASFERPVQAAHNDHTVDQAVQQPTCSNSGNSCISAGDQQQQLVVNPHPPFRGVFRDAMHAAGLLPQVLTLVMHSKPGQARRYRSSCFDGDGIDSAEPTGDSRQTCSMTGSALCEPGRACLEQQDTYTDEVKPLLVQVVAAACQLLIAVNQPLLPAQCAQVLEFLWDQYTHKQAATLPSTGQQASASLTGSPSASHSLSAAASHHAGAIWCLAQHTQHQQQLLMDGRWAHLLEILMKPSLKCVRRAVTASSRACCTSGGGIPVSASGSTASVPRLQLQLVQGQPGGTASSARSASGAADCTLSHPGLTGSSAAGSCCSAWNSSTAGASSKCVAEAVRILHLCLQSCWLLLQQEGAMRQIAAELPADLTAVYAKGKSSWWALELDKPNPAELSESDRLGLSLMVEAVALPDSWSACWQLKALALNSCWNLAHADQAMRQVLVQLGVPRLTTLICQAATGAACSSSGDNSALLLPAGQLQMAAAGYLTTAVQCTEAVAALGGANAAALLLSSLMASCINGRTPASVNTTLLGRVLSALAWLSARKEAAGACCKPKVVSALLDVLRLELQAYKALTNMAKEKYQQQCLQEQQQQQVPAAPARSQGAWSFPTSSRTCTNAPAAQHLEFTASAAQLAATKPESLKVPALPAAAVSAPFDALQQPDTWLPGWLLLNSKQRHLRALSTHSGYSSPTAYSQAGCGYNNAGRKGLRNSSPGSPGRTSASAAGAFELPSPGRTCNPGTYSPGFCSSPVTCRSNGGPPLSPGGGLCGSARAGCSSRKVWDESGTELESSRQAGSTLAGEIQTEVNTPDGSEGMLAVWALLNISTHHEGKVVVCKKGLYTLLRLVQHCPDTQRVAVVANILQNLTAAVENTAMIYRAELRLKHAALLKQAGIKHVRRERSQQDGSSRSGSPSAGAMGSGDLASKQQQWQQKEVMPAAALDGSTVAASAASAVMGFFEPTSTANGPRTTRLSIAADTACLVANMCNTGRGPPKNLSHEDEKAGALLSRVSLLTSRPALDVHRPERPEQPIRQHDLTAEQHAVKAFSEGVKGLVPAAASIAAGAGSRDPTPRSITGPAAAAVAYASAGPGGASGAASAQLPAGPPVRQPDEPRAAFLRWLQEQMPEAMGSADVSAAGSPRPGSLPGQAVQEAALKGLTKMADLGATTTEDAEEDEWLEQQRQAQKLHDFYAARAAQGELLRGSLASSLRSSTSRLWDSKVQQACKQQQQQQRCTSSRPMSAPGCSRASSPGSTTRSGKLASTAGGAECSALKSNRMQSIPQPLGGSTTSRTGQRPGSAVLAADIRPGSPSPRAPWTPTITGSSCPAHPTARTPSPVRCCSPTSAATTGRSRPRSAAGSLSSSNAAKGKPGAGSGAAPGGPWAPAIVEYRQQNVGVGKPWQVANQLLVAAAEEEVVQVLAGAATDLLGGTLPANSPPGVLRCSMQRKSALDLQLQQFHLSQSTHMLDVTTPGAATAQQDEQQQQQPEQWQEQQQQQEQQEQLQQWQRQQQQLEELQRQQQPEAGTAAAAAEPVQVSQSGARVTWREGLGDHAGDACASANRGGSWHGLVVDCSSACDDLYSSGTPVDEDADAALLLQRPKAAYAIPNHGTLSGKQYIPQLRGMFSAAVADSLRRSKQDMDICKHVAKGMDTAEAATARESAALAALGHCATDVPADIARPVTVLDVSAEVAAKPVQMLVKGSPDGTLPERLFNFHCTERPGAPNLTMHVFEHCDGAQFCNDLFGHYLLPNGRLAHVFLPPAAAKQGHVVAIQAPPVTPWDVSDWLPVGGLPAAPATELLAGYMQPGGAAARLPLLKALNWVPVPQLPPHPVTCSLNAIRNETGSLQLQPNLASFKAVKHIVMESREYRKPLPSKNTRRTASMVGAVQQSRPQQQQQQQELQKPVRPPSGSGTGQQPRSASK